MIYYANQVLRTLYQSKESLCGSFYDIILQKRRKEFFMNIAICDDEKVFHKELKDALCNYACDRNIDIYTFCFSNGTDLINSNELFDVIFMDYEMSGLDGIETSELIRKNNDATTIIFISAYPHVVFDTFSVNTFRFLTKPLDIKKMYDALDAYRYSIDKDNLLIIKTLEKTWSIKHSEIIYAEAKRKHTILRTSKNSLEIAKCLGEIESMLPKEDFFRVHKAFLVNFKHITNYDKSFIVFDNGERAALGNKYYTNFKLQFLNFIKKYNLRNL